jgi:hypothetical protein
LFTIILNVSCPCPAGAGCTGQVDVPEPANVAVAVTAVGSDCNWQYSQLGNVDDAHGPACPYRDGLLEVLLLLWLR